MTTARSLVVLYIDDKAEEQTAQLVRIQEFAELVVVEGIESAVHALREFDSRANPVIDIILCDVSMEFDPLFDERTREERSLNLTVRTAGITGATSHQFELDPTFAIEGLELQPERLRPFGPILALPFSRYFKRGGVVMPVSRFWADPRLVAGTGKQRRFNGYIFAALSLIWAQSMPKTEYSMEKFGPLFSELYNTSSLDGSPRSPNRFLSAVRKRRHQLYSAARLLPDLNLLQLSAQAPYVPDGDFRIVDAFGGVDVIKRRSLYADLIKELADPSAFRKDNSRNANRYSAHFSAIAELLQKEKVDNRIKMFDVEGLYHFCKTFAVGIELDENGDAVVELDENQDFVQKYNLLAANPNYGIAQCKTPGDVPPIVRRYLLIFVQLYFQTDTTEQPINEGVCSMFGFHDRSASPRKGKRGKSSEAGRNRARRSVDDADDSGDTDAEGRRTDGTRKLLDFVLGGRANKGFHQRASFDTWDDPLGMAPFLDLPASERSGWRQYQFLKPPKGDSRYLWTEFDADMASRFWSELVEGNYTSERLGFGFNKR